MGSTCQDLAGQRLELERQLCSRARALGGGGEGEGEGRGSTRTSGGGREQHEGVVVLERTEARRLAVNHLRKRKRDAAAGQGWRMWRAGEGGGHMSLTT